jgi:hypothetical protein
LENLYTPTPTSSHIVLTVGTLNSTKANRHKTACQKIARTLPIDQPSNLGTGKKTCPPLRLLYTEVALLELDPATLANLSMQPLSAGVASIYKDVFLDFMAKDLMILAASMNKALMKNNISTERLITVNKSVCMVESLIYVQLCLKKFWRTSCIC